MLQFIVERNKASYNFKMNPNKPSGFDNNYKNNSIDHLCVYSDKAEIVRFPCQTVANYCWGDNKSNGPTEHGDTIAEGYFKVKCFVEPRNFHGEIHGIIETKDIDGQWIDHESMQYGDDNVPVGRWLIHDRYSKKLGEDTTYAWSAGCFILSSGDLVALNNILKAYDVKPGDIIEGEVVEI